jgi:hypothetical protein
MSSCRRRWRCEHGESHPPLIRYLVGEHDGSGRRYESSGRALERYANVNGS